MQILTTKGFTWSYVGRLTKYKADQIATVDTQTGMQMIEAGYAVEAEHKMIDMDDHENKMLNPEADNKATTTKLKKSKKSKEVENE